LEVYGSGENVLSRRLARRSFGLNAAFNDQLEREVEVIEDGRTGPVSDYYSRLARYQVRLSDLGAWNFLQMDFFVLGSIVAALARYCARPGVEAGDIYAVFSGNPSGSRNLMQLARTLLVIPGFGHDEPAARRAVRRTRHHSRHRRRDSFF
jgi:hypothetical protein